MALTFVDEDPISSGSREKTTFVISLTLPILRLSAYIDFLGLYQSLETLGKFPEIAG
jgi:hypothetical protein